MSYTSRRSFAGPPALASAPVSTLPIELAAVVATAEALLDKRRQAMDRLAAFSRDIPLLLRELTTARPGKELEGARLRRETLARDRQELIRRLVDEEPDLTSARDALEMARQPNIADIVADFDRRYRLAVSQLQRMWREAEALANALRSPVVAPPPARIVGGETLGLHPWPSEITPARLELDRGPAEEVVIDPLAARVGKSLDGLSAAIEFCASIRNYQRRAVELAAQRYDASTLFDPNGIFVVAKTVNDLLIGVEYPVSTLIDASLVPVGMLARHVRARAIRPLGASSATVSASVPPAPAFDTSLAAAVDVPVAEA